MRQGPRSRSIPRPVRVLSRAHCHAPQECLASALTNCPGGGADHMPIGQGDVTWWTVAQQVRAVNMPAYPIYIVDTCDAGCMHMVVASKAFYRPCEDCVDRLHHTRLPGSLHSGKPEAACSRHRLGQDVKSWRHPRALRAFAVSGRG